MVFAYLSMWAVLSDPDMADKLTSGVTPPGTAVVGNRVAAVSAVLAALGAWIAAAASRRLLPVLVVLLAWVPFVPLALFTVVLAF